jgi:signal transduction histidine kinase
MKHATVVAHADKIGKADVRPGLDARANRYDVVSRLADDLAHEIRNPLNAIVVNLEVLRRRISTGAEEQALGLTHVIDQEIGRLNKLVDQLVYLMRPPRSESNPTALDETIEDMRPLLETQATGAQVSFEMQTASEVFTRVPRDVVKFALLNLITLAYAADGTMESVHVETRQAGESAEISVHCRPAVFVESSEYAKQARTLIESAGGTLEIRELSSANAGSTAVLRIPASRNFI